MVFFAAAVLLLLLPSIGEAQCAMCKAAVESNVNNDPNSVAKGINKGILYLMAVPYLLLMFIFRKQIAAVYRKIRRKEAPGTENL
jgi:hypothetical protein